MKNNSSETAYDRKCFIAEFVECECFNELIMCDNIIEEYNSSINEINAMIAHFIDIKNDEEVAFWRSFLQQTKVAKRRAKKMIEDNNRMGTAYSV